MRVTLQIQLFDLHSLAFKSSLRGHGQHVSCIDIASAPVNMLVSGSADKRVRVFDCRHSQPSLILSGHSSLVRSVQMDHWKVVSGRYDCVSTSSLCCMAYVTGSVLRDGAMLISLLLSIPQ